MEDENKLIKEIQDQCKYFAKDIVTRLCKRAIRKMNSWNIQIGSDNYPASLTSLIFFLLSAKVSVMMKLVPIYKNYRRNVRQ